MEGVADDSEDIGGGLRVWPTKYTPAPSWVNADGLPRCASTCGAAVVEKDSTLMQNQLSPSPRSYMCCIEKARSVEGGYCRPALIALREKASQRR